MTSLFAEPSGYVIGEILPISHKREDAIAFPPYRDHGRVDCISHHMPVMLYRDASR